MRDVTDVIDRMIAATPEGDDLRLRLEKIKKDAVFTAPEAMTRRWYEMNAAFHGRFWGVALDDLPEWGHTVGKIMSGVA